MWVNTYLQYTGQVDNEGRKFSTNTDTDGRFHSKWMNMIYPRLFLAKNLLKEDGVIFISIDDAEINNLKAICNEIFGEENFISQIIIQSNKRGQTYKEIAKTHEYLLVYSKGDNYEMFELEKDDDSLPFADKLGKYDLWELRNRNPKFGKFNRPNLYYPIYVSQDSLNEEGLANIALEKDNHFNIEVFPKNSEGIEGCWRWEKKTLKENLKEPFSVSVAKQKRDGDWNIYQKSRKSTTKAKSLWNDNSVISEQGTIEVGKLGLKNMFDHPKPISLVKRTVQIGSINEDIILDFFAGSSTTAHAIMELNKEDGGNRKFICIQLPQPIEETNEAYKAGYKTIADISKERIRKVINKIKEENVSNSEMFKADLSKIDLGFKVFKLSSSNFNVWDSNVEKTPEIIQSKLELHTEHINPQSTQEDILFELLLKSGFPITTPIEQLVIEGKIVFSIAEGELLICLEEVLTHELLKGIAERKPSRVICLDKAFKGENADALKTNAVQIMKSKGVVNFRTV